MSKALKTKNIPTLPGPDAVDMPAGQQGTDRSTAELEQIPLRTNDETDEQFPVDFATKGKDHKEDVLFAQKLEMQTDYNGDPTPGRTPFGQLIATDESFRTMQRLREREAEPNFQAWFAQTYDKMAPAQKAVARELFPEFYKQRMELLEKRVALAGKLAALKLQGIQTKDDMLLQYASEAGYIDSDPLEHILHPERAAQAQSERARQANFKRGLLNPRRLPRGDWGRNNRTGNAVGITGRLNAGDTGSAATFGTMGGAGFSANGLLDSNTEKNQNFFGQFADLFGI